MSRDELVFLSVILVLSGMGYLILAPHSEPTENKGSRKAIDTNEYYDDQNSEADKVSWSFETGVAKEETIDELSKAQVKQRVYISGDVTEDGLRNFLQDRYADLVARTGFDHYDNPTNVAVYVHETQKEAKSGGAGWLAALTKGKSDSQPDIQVDQRAVEAHNQRPTEQWGLAESTRKEMWRKYVELENKAMAQAKSRYPDNGNRRMSYEDKMIANYKSQLAQEYGVDEAIVDSVSLEGMMENWNLP